MKEDLHQLLALGLAPDGDISPPHRARHTELLGLAKPECTLECDLCFAGDGLVVHVNRGPRQRHHTQLALLHREDAVLRLDVFAADLDVLALLPVIEA